MEAKAASKNVLLGLYYTKEEEERMTLRIFGSKTLSSGICGSILASAMVLSAGSLFAAQSDTGAKQDMKNAGTDTKDAAKDTGRGVKKGTKSAYHGTKKGTKAAYHDTKKGTKKAVHSTARGTKHVANKVEGKTEPGPQ